MNQNESERFIRVQWLSGQETLIIYYLLFIYYLYSIAYSNVSIDMHTFIYVHIYIMLLWQVIVVTCKYIYIDLIDWYFPGNYPGRIQEIAGRWKMEMARPRAPIRQPAALDALIRGHKTVIKSLAMAKMMDEFHCRISLRPSWLEDPQSPFWGPVSRLQNGGKAIKFITDAVEFILSLLADFYHFKTRFNAANRTLKLTGTGGADAGGSARPPGHDSTRCRSNWKEIHNYI